MEERFVFTLNLGVLVLTLLSATVGGLSIHWARTEPPSWRCRGGHILFVVNLVVIGGTSLVAAFLRAPGLAPLGLVAGLLLVGMVWEGPTPLNRHRSAKATHIAPDSPVS
jgi:hypothetical protein